MRRVIGLLILALLLPACARKSADARGDRVAAEPAADTLAGMPPYDAYQRGLALGQMQRFAESLPYFRRALEVPPPAWQPYCDYAISLFHATHETRHGVPTLRPVTRSSYERVAMIQEALSQLDVAERMAQTAADRAFVIALRARYFKVWGLAWDALSEYHRAASLDERHLLRAFELADVMRDPVRMKATVEPPIAAPAPDSRAPFPEPGTQPLPPPSTPTPSAPAPAAPDSVLRPPAPAPDSIDRPPAAPDSAHPLPSEPDSGHGE
jgi:tetratricopeptide (TPR) repeat protein